MRRASIAAPRVYALAMICGLAASMISCRPQLMAGVNETGSEVIARVLLANGRAKDYLLPPREVVRLPTSDEVDRLVLFDGACRPLMSTEFGGPNNSFSYGGQVFVRLNGEAGYSSDIPARVGASASTSQRCATAPTPAGTE